MGCGLFIADCLLRVEYFGLRVILLRVVYCGFVIASYLFSYLQPFNISTNQPVTRQPSINQIESFSLVKKYFSSVSFSIAS